MGDRSKSKKSKSTNAKLERLALQGRDVTKYFKKGKIMAPLSTPERAVQRVNVDFSMKMLGELDQLALDLNISRQAVIKSLLMQALDHFRKNKEE